VPWVINRTKSEVPTSMPSLLMQREKWLGKNGQLSRS
jgi:hypothetical protein